MTDGGDHPTAKNTRNRNVRGTFPGRVGRNRLVGQRGGGGSLTRLGRAQGTINGQIQPRGGKLPKKIMLLIKYDILDGNSCRCAECKNKYRKYLYFLNVV